MVTQKASRFRMQSGMTTRRGPAWVPYFLQSLARVGEVRRAAAEAGIDFTSAYARRKRHPDFAAAWEAALAAYRARQDVDAGAQVAREVEEINGAVEGKRPSTSLGTNGEGTGPHPDHESGSEGPSGGWSAAFIPQAGEGEERRRRLALGGNGRWSKARERIFFEELAATANVRRAAKAAGVSTTAVYARRVKNRHFATKWAAIKELGRERLDDFLVEASNRTFDPESDPLPDCDAVPKVSVAEAIRIVQLHGNARQKRDVAEEVEPPEEEMNVIRDRLLLKLERLDARAREEKLEAGWQEDERFEDVLVPPGWTRVEEGAVPQACADPPIAD